MLHITNSLTRRKERFQPRQPGKVQMYVCGITVYDYCHIGHARMMVVFDMVARWLRASGYELTYVRNITDIEDKIIKRAVEAGEPIKALTERFITAMHEDEDALGVLRPDHEPRATDYVPQMIDLISLLKNNGYAYQSGDGDMNYSVRRFKGYGKLSGRNPDELRAGERVAVSRDKQDPLDFVLWKASKPDEPTEAQWDSVYGKGRPGWHIECSAMARALLGDELDIHGGGEDLQFPHHENEIAQTEGALFPSGDGQLARYWLHNAFVRIDDEKMSKSLGNFFTIRQVQESFDAEVVRFFILRAHYRSPLNYSDAHLEEARQSLLRLYTARGETQAAATAATEIDWTRPLAARFQAAMNDDFNTPMALAVLFEMAAELNRERTAAGEAEFLAAASILGLLGKPLDEVRRTALRGSGAADQADEAIDDAWIEQQIQARRDAKAARDFAGADAIRQQLLDKGVVLEDSRAGTTWRRQ